MKILIFAGGHGTRLWPLSRKNSPKQFDPIFDGKSTLQLTIERVRAIAGIESVYVSTNIKFKKLIETQVPDLPSGNLFLEPERRDLAAAVGLSFMKLKEQGVNEPVAIVWADHIMEEVNEFREAIKIGEKLIIDNPNRFVYLAEKPRFPNHNLGWITIGKKLDTIEDFDVHEFLKWDYRPELEKCKKMFKSGKSFWNPGYWITSLDFVLGLYKEHMPAMYSALDQIIKDPNKLEEIYPTLESISFDDSIIAKTTPEEAVVIRVDLGWSDPGTLYALKEALAESENDNVTQGKTFEFETRDSLVINKEDKKLIVSAGLDGMVVINTEDVLLVVHKDNVPNVKKIVGELEQLDLEEYT